mmetsp:Transcript_29517/g.53058  ORF Transcript_29517/g.53058 Transcript_29517/m.53058 type:complete len:245 (+) Transcript_29517:839-1573(+)
MLSDDIMERRELIQLLLLTDVGEPFAASSDVRDFLLVNDVQESGAFFVPEALHLLHRFGRHIQPPSFMHHVHNGQPGFQAMRSFCSRLPQPFMSCEGTIVRAHFLQASIKESEVPSLILSNDDPIHPEIGGQACVLRIDVWGPQDDIPAQVNRPTFYVCKRVNEGYLVSPTLGYVAWVHNPHRVRPCRMSWQQVFGGLSDNGKAPVPPVLGHLQCLPRLFMDVRRLENGVGCFEQRSFWPLGLV